MEKYLDNSTRYLTLKLSDRQYGFPIDSIKEIIRITEMTSVPNTPHFILGVINLRGKVIPIVDLRLKFGVSASAFTKETCIIVVETNENEVGVIVDSVHDVSTFTKDQINELPPMDHSEDNIPILGFGQDEEGITILIDISETLSKDNLTKVTTSLGYSEETAEKLEVHHETDNKNDQELVYGTHS